MPTEAPPLWRCFKGTSKGTPPFWGVLLKTAICAVVSFYDSKPSSVRARIPRPTLKRTPPDCRRLGYMSNLEYHTKRKLLRCQCSCPYSICIFFAPLAGNSSLAARLSMKGASSQISRLMHYFTWGQQNQLGQHKPLQYYYVSCWLPDKFAYFLQLKIEGAIKKQQRLAGRQVTVEPLAGFTGLPFFAPPKNMTHERPGTSSHPDVEKQNPIYTLV